MGAGELVGVQDDSDERHFSCATQRFVMWRILNHITYFIFSQKILGFIWEYINEYKQFEMKRWIISLKQNKQSFIFH